ncbi:hypothetical protein GOODEAATRI_009030, partial [Goodea atripinnis]
SKMEETEAEQLHHQQTGIAHTSEGGLDSGQGSTVFSSDSPHLGQLSMSYSCPPSSQPPSQPQTPYPQTAAAVSQQHPGYSQPAQPRQVQTPTPKPSSGPPLVPAATQPDPAGMSQQAVLSGQSSATLQSPTHTTLQQVPAQSASQSSELPQGQLQPPQVLSFIESCHSETSGLSDGNEGGGGRHEGRSTKRHQRRSVRSRSRHEKISKAKLHVLSISNRGDRVAECQLETHNRKMVTFRFDLDGDNPEEIAKIMVESEFILESERESFIEQVREVIENADQKGLERDPSGQQDGGLSLVLYPKADLRTKLCPPRLLLPLYLMLKLLSLILQAKFWDFPSLREQSRYSKPSLSSDRTTTSMMQVLTLPQPPSTPPIPPCSLQQTEASSESLGKPDDIQALDMKLRSLFMDLGGGVPSTQGDILAADPATGASVAANLETRVGRFSVSLAQEQICEPKQSPPPAARAANGPSDSGQVLSPDPPHKASLPSLNNNSFNNSYMSSDNDSEFEDEDFKREVSRLREK